MPFVSVTILFRVQFQITCVCTSKFFKRLKLNEPLRRVQSQLFEKLTRANTVNLKLNVGEKTV